MQFVLPSANTDGSRPANIERVDVYALTGPAPLSDNEVVKAGTRVGIVAVKAPRDPNETIDADDPDSDLEPLEGPGLDQGAVAHVRELLSEATLTPSDATVRTYVAVGISTRGRRGPLSKRRRSRSGRRRQHLAPPTVTYDETAITIGWTAARSAASETERVSRVRRVAAGSRRREAADVGTRDAADRHAVDRDDVSRPPRRVERERCYTVRAVRRIGDLSIEGDAAPPRCLAPADTFAPAAPTGLTAVASEGAINLIWTPNQEADLAGYLVLRAAAPSSDLVAMSPTPIAETTFSDTVQPGMRYTYAIQAVDTAGNVSPASARVEETAR